MKINEINIEGIGGIKKLKLNFNNGLNLICGTNGVGKTTILECIAHFFIDTRTAILKKNVSSEVGKCNFTLISTNNQMNFFEYTLKSFEPTQNDFINKNMGQKIDIMYFKTKRDFKYTPLDAIPRDITLDDHSRGQQAYSGIGIDDMKGWFMHRYAFSAHKNSLTPEQITNFELAKKCFNILDKDINFSKVKADSLDIMVNTRQGEVYFEYLSSGYKSCVFILLGIIKEIEYRFKNPTIYVEEFNGVVLIDEIELHLHPVWQAALVAGIKKLLPLSQIIATTHSPSIIQCAEPNEIIALDFNENSEVFQKQLHSTKYGFQGWSLEEILKDVMGMEITNSELFLTTFNEFDKALDNNNIESIKKNYEILDEMLYPSNPLRKVIKIQMAGLGE